MRLFTAVKISPGEKLLKILELPEDNLKYDKIRWVNPNNLHITLKFLGETDEKKLPEIIDLHTNICKSHSSFKLNIENIGVFGSSYQPKVIWLGLNPVENIGLIAMELADSLSSIGFKIDRQNFVPHLTIGRVSSIQNNSFFQKVISLHKSQFIQEYIVNKIGLYESILTPKGAIHNIIGEFELNHKLQT